MGYLLGIVLILIVLVTSAWVWQTMWFWFVVPLGMDPLTLAHAFGLALFISYSTKHIQPPSSEKSEQFKAAQFDILRMIIVLALGWVAATFFM